MERRTAGESGAIRRRLGSVGDVTHMANRRRPPGTLPPARLRPAFSLWFWPVGRATLARRAGQCRGRPLGAPRVERRGTGPGMAVTIDIVTREDIDA